MRTTYSVTGSDNARSLPLHATTGLELSTSDTIPGNSSTRENVGFDNSDLAYINSATDTDWFSVHLVAGVSYTFALNSLVQLVQPTLKALPDPYLQLYDSASTLLSSDDNGGGNLNAAITFTATTTGTYYLAASSHDGQTGYYTVGFSDAILGSTATKATLALETPTVGILESHSDTDWYAVTLTAGQSYDFSLSAYTSDGLLDPNLVIYDGTGKQVATNDDINYPSNLNSFLHFTATTSGTYYVSAGSSAIALSGENTGLYTVKYSVSLDTIAGDRTTTAHLDEGGSTTSAIDFDGDQDWYAVTLTAGQIYDFSMAGSGSTPLTDPYLEIYDSNGALQASNDDNGTSRDSHLSFYATQSGTYYIAAESWQGSDTKTSYHGGYTLSLATGVKATTDTVGNSASAINDGHLTIGQATAGRIDTPDDKDFFAVDLRAGQSYDFDLTNPGPSASVVLSLYDDFGTLVAQDVGDGASAHLDFDNNRSGRFYLSASISDNSGYGNYTITANTGDQPLLTQSIDWGTKLTLPGTVVHVYFAKSGETFDDETSVGWTGTQNSAVMQALGVYSNYINLTFVQTTDASQADFKFVMAATLGDNGADTTVAFMEPPGEPNAGVAVFSQAVLGTDLGGNVSPNGFAFEAMLHEIGHGLGLAHPFDKGGTSPIMTGVLNSGDYGSYGYQNQGVYTVMSYNDGWPGNNLAPSAYTRGYEATPMAIDVAALQAKYGANTTYHAGNDTYLMSSVQNGFSSIWDTGGNDTISAATLFVPAGKTVTIDLRPATMYYNDATGGGVVSYVSGTIGGYTIDQGVVIENAVGSTGTDSIIGNSADNNLSGLAGNDTLTGGGGNDTLDGGDGTDTAIFAFWVGSSKQLVSLNGTIYVRDLPTHDVDTVRNVEQLQFYGSTVAASSVSEFDAMQYLAANTDLIQPFKTDQAGALQHYLNHGIDEGRGKTFDALEYMASNPDLRHMAQADATKHYVLSGYGEHRNVNSFDAMEYLASNVDLLKAFGVNTTLAELHYVNNGFDEHRQTTSFNAMEYLASNVDLIRGFGANTTAAEAHYVAHGYAEQRATTTFNALEYIASNPDLIGAFGVDAVAGLNHYVAHGYYEHRNTTTFDVLEYIASNPDLIGAFGADTAAGLYHYDAHGYSEHRSTTSFDALEYIASNSDLLVAFGANTAAAELHYDSNGYAEHRSTNSFNAAQYLANYTDLAAAFGNDLHAAELHYILYGYAEHRTDHMLT